MRLTIIAAAILAALALSAPAEAARARSGYAARSQCHCDRYLNPHASSPARYAYRRRY